MKVVCVTLASGISRSLPVVVMRPAKHSRDSSSDALFNSRTIHSCIIVSDSICTHTHTHTHKQLYYTCTTNRYTHTVMIVSYYLHKCIIYTTLSHTQLCSLFTQNICYVYEYLRIYFQFEEFSDEANVSERAFASVSLHHIQFHLHLLPLLFL